MYLNWLFSQERQIIKVCAHFSIHDKVSNHLKGKHRSVHSVFKLSKIYSVINLNDSSVPSF